MLKSFLKTSRQFFTIFVLFVALASHVFAASMDEGVQAYKTGNYKLAFEIFSSLADQGYLAAHYNLGIMYEKGYGVLQSYKNAAKWYRTAALLGYVDAQFKSGNMCLDGTGVEQSNWCAYAWWTVAAANGHETARENMEAAKTNMSLSEIEEGQEFAKEIWKIMSALKNGH